MSASPAVTGRAAVFATELLWSLTGRRFGFTSVKLRPCREYSTDTPYPDAWLSWPGTMMPPLGATGTGGYYGFFFSAGCGSCRSGCSCAEQVRLPAPVHTVTEVRVDGSPLVSGAYRVDDNRQLVRVDGLTWPVSNNLSFSDTAAGTWSVTAQYGESVPGGGADAMGEVACEYIRAAAGEDCRLPRGVTQLARQGVTITMPDLGDMLDKGRTGLRLADLFIAAWNPGHLRQRARVYSVDRGTARRAGT